jgi:hypothetical protein
MIFPRKREMRKAMLAGLRKAMLAGLRKAVTARRRLGQMLGEPSFQLSRVPAGPGPQMSLRYLTSRMGNVPVSTMLPMMDFGQLELKVSNFLFIVVGDALVVLK